MIRRVFPFAVPIALALPLLTAAVSGSPAGQEEASPREERRPALARFEEELRWMDSNLQLLPEDFVPGPGHEVVQGAPLKRNQVTRIRLRRPMERKQWVLTPDVLSGSHGDAHELAAERGLGIKYFTHSLPSEPITKESADAAGVHLVWMQQDRTPGWPMAEGSDINVSVHRVPLAQDFAVEAFFSQGSADFSAAWVEVPDLIGMSTADAQGAATALQLNFVAHSNLEGAAQFEADTLPSNAEVAVQFPEAGDILPQGMNVDVVLVDRPAGLEPESTEGKTQRWLGSGPRLLPPDFEPDETHQIVQGVPAPDTDQITLVWLDEGGGDAEWTEVPQVVEMSASDAATEVAAHDLVIEYYSNVVPPSLFTGSTANHDVQSQTPAAGTTVEKGTKVKVVIVIQSGNRVP